jgi:peroxygenase
MQIRSQASPKPPRNALQRHADYFDGNKDGQVTVAEAYRGMRDLGLGPIAAGLGAVAGNAFLGPATGAPWYSPLSIQTDNIGKGKHPGDSGTFDADGNFDQSKLVDMYDKHDSDRDGALSQAEIKAMIAANKGGSRLGAFLSTVEFGLLMKVAGEQRELAGGQSRVLTREKMQGFYEGTLLYTIAGQAIPS